MYKKGTEPAAPWTWLAGWKGSNLFECFYIYSNLHIQFVGKTVHSVKKNSSIDLDRIDIVLCVIVEEDPSDFFEAVYTEVRAATYADGMFII